MENKPLFEKMFERAEHLKQGLVKKPTVDVMESIRGDGVPNQYIAYGHHNFEEFQNACMYHYSVKPYTVRHRYHKTMTVPVEDGKAWQTTVFSNKDDPDSKPITVGII